jgi:nucleoid-associated protein YgaU
MPNDAKLGLVIGVGVVIAIAVVFYRQDGANALPLSNPAAAASVRAKPSGAGPSSNVTRVVKAKPTARRHLVQEGETLAGLAEKYYGDKEKADTIYQANRELLKSPQQIDIGAELVIPEMESEHPAP